MSKILTICPEELSDDKAYSYGGRAVEKDVFIEFYKRKKGIENTPSEEELFDFSLKNSFSKIKGMVPVKISENKMVELYHEFLKTGSRNISKLTSNINKRKKQKRLVRKRRKRRRK